MANLITTISESVTLNGSVRGSTNTLTTTGIVDVMERIVTCTHSQTTTIAVFAAAPYTSAGAIDVDRTKYIRVTNLDSSNPVIINLQQQEAEHASNVGDQNAGILLSAGKSFMMGEAHDCIDVEGGANDINALSDLHDLESIMVDPLAAEVKVEIFIALVV